MTQAIVSRFAPSPTGYMTIGNFRTALLSYLFAKAHQGRFLLRFEDTDRQRSLDEYTAQITRDMHVMGLEYDQSLVWHQSQRGPIYEQYFEELRHKGYLYECFCTPEDLAIERKVQLSSGKPPRYSGRCRSLSVQQKEALAQSGQIPVLRFAIPSNWSYTVDDLRMGPKVFQGSDIGDFVVRKADGDPTFFFCNAIDDSLAGVTHVLRGDDHLSNTPRQAAILQALGLTIPQYAHFPMILGSDHKPLSKRNGSSSIKQLIEEGYRPEAIINYLARLGSPQNNPELLSLEQLAQDFRLEKLSRSSAHYDPSQLDQWQRKAFQSTGIHQRDIYLEPYQEFLKGKNEIFWQLCLSELAMPADIALWVQRLHQPSFIIDKQQFESFGWDESSIHWLKKHWGTVPWQELVAELKAQGIQGAKLFKPLRLLMTGILEGPELPLLYDYIQPDIVQQRFPF